MDWESAVGDGHEFLDEVCPLVLEDVEFCFLSSFVEGLSESSGRVAVVAVLLVSSSRLELR